MHVVLLRYTGLTVAKSYPWYGVGSTRNACTSPYAETGWEGETSQVFKTCEVCVLQRPLIESP